MALTELKIVDEKIGTGTEVVKGALVICHYTGTLADGAKFDSSIDRGRPFQFVIGSGRVIRGWDIGILGMRVGGKRRLEVPAAMAYGERAIGKIPPNSDLYFEVELLEARPREG
ncbi:MAG: FKBP-type peptidyl-prolyl cis-trans isomerase [Bdellovibrionales bacterium]|nr:FKBP-type peptidyl-prolyl cis-trans isomerase [Bdellovibrionales bacterium]